MMMFPIIDYYLGSPNSNIWHGNQPIMNNFESSGFSHPKKKKKMRVAELSFRQHQFYFLTGAVYVGALGT